MERLPDEVLLIILEFLPVTDVMDVVGRVCRRWAALVRGRVLVMRRPCDSVKLHAGLHTLQMVAYIPSPGAFIADVVHYVPRLRHLTVYAAAPLTAENFADLARLTNLDHLDVFASARAYDGRLATVARRLGSFVVNESVAPGLLRAIAVKSNLRALYMYGRSMHYPRRELIAVVRARAAHLTELVLRCSELSDTAYETIGECANLTSLQLYSCWLMSATAALHVTRPRRLRKLHVTGARLVRSPVIASVVDQLPPGLHELDLSCGWFGDEHIETLAVRVPTLRVFEAWHCRLTRDGAVNLAIKLPNLETLDLDLILFERHLKMLGTHPSLKLLRCLTELNAYVVEEADMPPTKVVRSMARIQYLSSKVSWTQAEYEELHKVLQDEAALEEEEELEEEAEKDKAPIMQEITTEQGAEGYTEATEAQHPAKAEKAPPREKPEYKFRLISTGAKYARRYFRGGNEGYRATLFYYWTRHRQLEPLPTHMQPNYDDEDNGFYY